ncbi:urea ABC transporter permease subunit UrtC [Verrucomicrobia bacterium S94]|nr:urea ABC transporter permease subunit UrtC [Verrucomicrobia bacterium S94]
MTERTMNEPAGIHLGSRCGTSAGQMNISFAGVVLAIAVLLPLLAQAGLVSVETVNMAGRYMALAIVALGLDLIWGYTGILSLCQAFFFALGGYAMGIHLAHQGTLHNGIPEALYVVYPYKIGETRGMEVLPWFWQIFKPFTLTVILGILLPGLVAGCIGFAGFLSRVRGVYFSILTQALTVAAMMFFSKNEMKLCGTNGLTHFKTIAGHDLSDPSTKIGLYVVTLLCLIGAYLICLLITKTRFGRVLLAVRDSETALRFAGYKPYAYKTAIFVFAGMLAGLAGLLYTPQANIMTPSYMEARWSILMVIWVAVGGRGTLVGAVTGALVINLLYSMMTSQWSIGRFDWKPDYWPFVLGLLFIVVVLALPHGIVGLWRKLIGKLAELD